VFWGTVSSLLLSVLCLATFIAEVRARAESPICNGNPNALGISRTIEIDAIGGPRFGSRQYGSLNLRSGEVVLTFDDGPKPKITEAVLDALDHHCVKATFFEIGKSVAAYPTLTRKVLERGHTVGSHSWSHPPNLNRVKLEKAKQEIERGFDVLRRVSGGRSAPFFRYPSLKNSAKLNRYLAERDIAVFSADIITDDSAGIGPLALVTRTLKRLELTGQGILLFHDTKNATAAALPKLLDELARRGYRVVHIVPKSRDADVDATNRR
jgi:peptidoglycan/xylan/chitin deacetylase (PgdA/CDA1 family)